ncbi:hypothetical protein DQX05_02950 [Paenibacillus thiaminolyticus]|uniref:Uncharacterized protein n=1 Tax=Paenibacillus thiaminolyticus TaxID=49283 RepID=A0A3A3GNW2_PANTH|nr:hypothetical protein DQX05_02950 [Paenibacillus thiaminolyticus]
MRNIPMRAPSGGGGGSSKASKGTGNVVQSSVQQIKPPAEFSSKSLFEKANNTLNGATGNNISGRDTLKPGPYASGSIQARGKGRNFTKEERNKINEFGKNTGCHTCGNKNPGTKTVNFIPDHQPPNSTVPNGTPQQLYPHCKSCSAKQGGTLGAMKKQEKATRRP